jgi:hypothetical protein
MVKFNGKIFNPNVFEKYLRTLPSTKLNTLINNALFTNVNKYKAKMSEQAGGYFVTEPIKGRIGGTPVNYDGNTDIPKGVQRDTFFQTKICYGRAMSWGEDDFTVEITGENFKAEAGEVKEYWDEQRQETVLAILKGIFGMTDTVGKKFAEKHTYEVKGNLDADSCNKASQKALGDHKQNLQVMYMHSAVSTNLEGLNLINFLKYTDSDGIERDLTIGTYNGKLVIVDDDMPSEEVAPTYTASSDTTVQEGKTYYTRSGSAGAYTYTVVANPTGNPSTSNYYEMTAEGYTTYTSYMFKNGFFEYENLGVKEPVEVARDAYKNGGRDELISRIREMIVPTLISYKTTSKISPENTDFASGSNWELVNNGETETIKKVFIDDKLIPVVRIISRG